MFHRKKCDLGSLKQSRVRHAPIESLEQRVLFSTYIVTGLGDGAGAVKQLLPGMYSAPTLRSAINAANVKNDSDVIIFNPLLSGTIKLTAALGELAITNNVAIQGFGASRQTIDGGGAIRVFNISAGVKAEISDLTISNAQNEYTGGGGIRNLGTLTLRGDTLRNNNLVGADGAGVYNAGVVNVYNSSFVGNTSSASGGGLFNRGTATIANSTFFGNTADFGGGLYNFDGASMLISNCTISGNTALTSGGGVAGVVFDQNATPAGTKLNNSIVAGNTFLGAGGALGPDMYGIFDFASSNNLIGNLGFAKGMDPLKNKLGSIENATPAIDPKLAPLGYYGGFTQTMPLLSGSPASNAGKNTLVLTGLCTDQRGNARIAGGTVDIGAVEGGTAASPFGGIVLLVGDLLKSLF